MERHFVFSSNIRDYSSMVNVEKELHGVVTVYTDITKRMSEEESIKASLREKEVLLKELPKFEM